MTPATWDSTPWWEQKALIEGLEWEGVIGNRVDSGNEKTETTVGSTAGFPELTIPN